MKTNIRPNRKIAAFSMIEMIGVLAVIAILAALLIPKVFDAINSAKINNTASALNTVKTAVVTHFGKYGALNSWSGGTIDPANFATAKEAVGYDTNVLVVERIMDKPFEAKIGTGACIELVAVKAPAPTGAGGSYWLSGQSSDGAPVNDTAPASMIVQAHLLNVPINDAIELSRCIDGTTLGTNVAAAADVWGRVQYAKPATATPGVTDVFVYMESK